MPVYKPKKAKSPTGKPSKVNPDVDDAMRGKGGKRPPPPPPETEPGDDSDHRAKKMDSGLPLRQMKKKKSGRMSQKIPKGYDY